MTTFICPICSKEFYNSKAGAKLTREKVTCPYCGKKILPELKGSKKRKKK